VEADSPLLQDANAAVAAVKDGTASPTTFERSSLRAIQDDGSFNQELIESTGVSDLRNEQYKLLFAGEVVGFAWTKTPSARSLVLQCQDLSNYWDYAYQWSNTDLFGPGYKALFSGGSTNLFTDFLEDKGSAILRILMTPSTQYPALKGLLGGIVHLLEAVGGSYYYDKVYCGQNIFFSIAELRLRITQMITAYENDPSARQLIAHDGFDSLFGRTLGNLGEQVSIRQAINALQAIIFHETYGQPCPSYTPGTGGSISGFERKKVRDDPALSFISTTADGLLQSLETLKQDVTGVTTDVGSFRASLRQRLGAARNTCLKTVQQAQAKNIQAAKSIYSSVSSTLGIAASQVARWTPGAPANTAITAKLDEAITQLRRASNLEANVTPKKKAVPARLNQQIFRPDVWFSAPPRCNVLFPEHYSQIDYQRMFLQEPTRLLLKLSDEFFGEDELFDSFYFAPKAVGVKSEKNTLMAILQNDLLDHELFTGILPVFEKMGEFNIFAVRAKAQKGGNQGVQSQFQQQVNKSGEGVFKVGPAQRSANFLYFKYRFASRQMQVTSRFNPYVACGFPGLIIERPIDADGLKLFEDKVRELGGTPRAASRLLGTHFLGSFTEVQHTISQSQQMGLTTIRCSYPRQPDEGIEFLGVLQHEQSTVQKRQGADALRRTDVAAITPPKVGAVGPNLGEIRSVQEVSKKYRSQDFQSAQRLPLFQSLRDKKGSITTTVPIGFVAQASEYGDDVVQFVGDPNIVVEFRAFEVEESVPRYKKEVVDLPPEEYIRPGWYGSCWHPSEISAVYQQFFKTGAITEPTQVTDSLGRGFSSSDAISSLSDQVSAVGPDDSRVGQASVLSLVGNRSIEEAVAFLVLVYSYIKQGGLDVNEFIKTYTWRPIASMVDMFGSSDLKLSEDGQSVVQGVEGFHSRAFGDFDDLFSLVTPEIETALGVSRGSAAASRLDTRKRKRDAVREYLAQTLGTRSAFYR